MYRQDSFFDLSPWGQFGLICISTALFLAMLLICRALLSNHHALFRVGGALLLFWLFVWISPQVYYEYYRQLIPSLPRQWVIWPPEHPQTALSYLFFQGPQNLSAHSQGLLGWSMIAAPFLPYFSLLRKR